MATRHVGLEGRIVVALRALVDIQRGLPAAAHDNAWWPYIGQSESRPSDGPPSVSPSLAAGESDWSVDYRRGCAHLERAMVALQACHAGERWPQHRRHMRSRDLPRDIASPADCHRWARWMVNEVGFLARVLDDDEATDPVLDELDAFCTEVGNAHRFFTRAAPIQPGGRGVARRPTRPARRRGR